VGEKRVKEELGAAVNLAKIPSPVPSSPRFSTEERTMRFEESALRVTWTNDLEGNKELFAGVQKANTILGEELGRAKGFITGNWKLERNNQNHAFIELTLTDLFTRSEVRENFDADELRNEAHLQDRFHRMWGRLLHCRTDAQLKRLEELVGQQEG
jgi:hypothetical protein